MITFMDVINVYIKGGIGIIWFMIWLFVSYEKPSEHPGITTAELKMIAESQGTTALNIRYEKHTAIQTYIFEATCKTV